MLPVVAFLLTYRGFRRTEKILARVSRRPRHQQPAEDARRARMAGRMVSMAATHGTYRAQCLEQAVTLWWMLGLMSIDSTIRLGIYKLKSEEGGEVKAHAWVLHQEEIVIGEFDGMEDYEPLLDVNVERP